MQKITTFLTFNNQAGEAIDFYTSVFKNSKVLNVTKYPPGAPGPEGEVMTGSIEIEGQLFMLLNGGPTFTFTEGISLFVNCEDQEEVDYYWDALTAGAGEEGQCGWLKDKFGVSWQIIPKQLGEALNNSDKEKAQRAMQAMLKMKKLIVKDLEEA